MLYRYIKEEVNKTFSMESGGRSGRERGGGGSRCLEKAKKVLHNI